jgi:hypothetical protein
MKKLWAVVSFGIALSTSAFANTIDVGFVETVGAGPDTLSVTGFSGAIIGGHTDNWTITMPGIMFDPGLQLAWVEPGGNLNGVNVLSAIGGDELRLISEAPFTGFASCGVPTPLPLGASCLIGADNAGNQYYGFVTEVAATPLPAALPLFAAGLGGLGLFGWRRKRKAQAVA